MLVRSASKYSPNTRELPHERRRLVLSAALVVPFCVAEGKHDRAENSIDPH